jgi:predicted phosphodiesterase
MNWLRVAILSDIHGNSLALDAVLADINAQGGVDEYWLLGDYVAIGPDPAGVLARLDQLPQATFTRGNTDRYVAHDERPFPLQKDAVNNPELLDRYINLNSGFAWTKGAVTAVHKLDWLANLPLEHRLTLPDGTRFLGVHAAPGTDDGAGFKPGMDAEQMALQLTDCNADLVVVGHTHLRMDEQVGNVRLVNLGSVSNPVGSDLRAKYIILTADENSTTIETRFVDYDHQAIIDAVEAIGHPSASFISQFMRGEM